MGILDYPTGIFYRSFNLAKGLAALGHDVEFISTQKKGEFKFPWKREVRNSVSIISFPSIMPTKIKKLGYAPLPIILKYYYIRSQNYDICHSDNHRPSSFLPLWVYSKMKNTKLFIEWMDFFGKGGGRHESKKWIYKLFIGNFDNYLEKKSVLACDGVVVLSEYLRNKAIELGRLPKDIVKVWGGSDIDQISCLNNASSLKKKYSLPVSTRIYSVANLGVEETIKYKDVLLKILAKDGQTDSIIIKTGSESDLITKHFGDKLIQFGNISYLEYCDLLSCSDCFILIQQNIIQHTSKWPNIIGDFLAAGKPTIVKPVGEATICAKMYSNAFIKISSENQSVVDFKELEEKSAYKNQEKIRQIAENEFSWANRSKQLERFYKKFI